MDQTTKLNQYRQLLQEVIEMHAAMPGVPETTESVPICDPVHDNFLLMDIGGEGRKRKGYIVVHLRLKDGKVRVEQDGIEYGIGQDLIEAGIPEEDIVYTFYKDEVLPTAELIAA